MLVLLTFLQRFSATSFKETTKSKVEKVAARFVDFGSQASLAHTPGKRSEHASLSYG